MTVDPKKIQAKEFVEAVAKKLPIQHQHDQFMLGALARIRDCMDSANHGINSKVEVLLAKGEGNKDVQAQLASVLRMSTESGNSEGIVDLQAMMSSRASIDTQLQALLGIVQYSILLAGRIEVFRKIFEVVLDAGTDDVDDEVLRVKLLKYGPQLQYVWEKAFQECRSLDERQMFSKAIFGKEIKLGS
jgi:hypothetical protein